MQCGATPAAGCRLAPALRIVVRARSPARRRPPPHRRPVCPCCISAWLRCPSACYSPARARQLASLSVAASDSAVPVRPSTRGRTSRLSSFALVSSNGKLADAPASPTAIAHPPSSHIVVLPACARQYLLCRRISGSTGAVNEGEKQHRAAFQAQVRPAYGASEGRAASSVCCSCRSPFAHSCSAAPTPTAAPLLGWAIPAGQEAGRRRAMPPQGGRQAGRRGWGASGNSQN